MSQLEYLSKRPKIYPISNVNIPEIKQYLSTHDIPVIEVSKEGCGVVLIDLVFRAGRPQESKKLVASCCGAMLREGAGRYNAQQLSEEIDFLGATLTTKASLDYIMIKAVCLKKHLKAIVDLIGAVVSEPHFDEQEWGHFIQKSKERLKLQLAKNDISSYRRITEEMYGSDHPYGYNSSAVLYDSIDVRELRSHHRNYLTAQNCFVFLSGDIAETDRGLIDKMCKSILTNGEKGDSVKLKRAETTPGNIYVNGSTKQTSLRIGRLAFTRNHPDFDALNYVCNLLGGYFGSRLISKIREEKGLTYGIYCTLDSQVYDGDIIISAEVANENVEQVLVEIYNEMDRLCEDLVEDRELELVNNYMMGNYLNLFDGPFNSIRAIKSLALAQIPMDNINTLIRSSLAFDACQIRDIARRYFDRNDFWNVFVGIPQ